MLVIVRTRMCMAATVLALTLAAGPVRAWPVGAAHIAGIWATGPVEDCIHFLDSNLNDLGGFTAGAVHPNGLATDGTLIWSGHASTREVVAYDAGGAEVFRWSADVPHLQGLEYISENELANPSSNV